MEISCHKQLHNKTLPSTDISALGHIKLQFKPAATFAFQFLPVTCTAAPTHPGGLHSFLPGGSSSRLFRGTIPMAACMMVMNFLNFIFQIPLQMQKKASHGAQRTGCCYASTDHLPNERRAKRRQADLKSKRPLFSVRHGDLANLRAEKMVSFLPRT